MQREIKKRVQMYGVAAVFLAAILGALCYNFGVNIIPLTVQPSQQFLKTFSSKEELRNFLLKNSKTSFPYFSFYDLYFSVYGFRWPFQSVTAVTEGMGGGFTYSTTNVQVAGVDEADIVKTDGTYIYLIANNSVFILKAYPPDEAQMLSKITFNNSYLKGIFINSEGDRLVVLGSSYIFPSSVFSPYWYWCPVNVKTFIYVYDISNKASPVMKREFAISGSYFSSRMIGEYVYAVVSQPVYIIYDTVILPKTYSKGEIEEIEASQIYYSETSDDSYAFTTVVALNMLKDEEKPNTLTVMMGGTSNMYVSLNNIYVTFHGWNNQTSIYRIRIENKTLTCEAEGKVPGRELNQFSMDEYNNHFRIATTIFVNGTRQNNLYIFDMNLSMIGKLENITYAFNEQLDSARFIGDRCYLATSVVQVVPRDPFLVINVADPSNPEVLGFLKIPGFTRYLHPYNENHVIGVGRDENSRVKISIFDVSNVSAPIEIDKYVVEGIWSDTPVLTDHKAFLFDKSKELLVIPVSISLIPLSISLKEASWQGVYVFNINITLSDKLVLKGNVTHQEVGVWNSNYWIQRALYIDNVLYTTSNAKLKMNSLEDLEFINEVELS
ncbi:MAG: beta-propeller domain-containing protein [Candidatus Bathyarchaeia archaeon]